MMGEKTPENVKNSEIYVMVDGIWWRQPDTDARRLKIDSMLSVGALHLADVRISPTPAQLVEMEATGIRNTVTMP
jgi:hypothetical protein